MRRTMIDRPETFPRLDRKGSAAFAWLGTYAVPKPRRWASRQPKPRQRANALMDSIPLALAFTLRALFDTRKEK